MKVYVYIFVLLVVSYLMIRYEIVITQNHKLQVKIQQLEANVTKEKTTADLCELYNNIMKTGVQDVTKEQNDTIIFDPTNF